jgi:metal transporter CNNM
MGLMSLEPFALRLKEMEGTAEERKAAATILPVVKQHHHLLVSLLLVNAGANEALPIFLDKMVDAKTAILLSVTGVLIVGEIMPSAIMTGPHQLRLAAALVPVVRALMWLTAPISWPLAKLLDWALGQHGGMTGYKRQEFKALMRLQQRTKPRRASLGRRCSLNAHSESKLRRMDSSHLRDLMRSAKPPVPTPPVPGDSAQESHSFTDDQVKIVCSIFDLEEKSCLHLLEPGRNTFEHVHAISLDDAMDYPMMDRIMKWGYSRVPVFRGKSRTNIVGVMLVKEHLMLDPDDAVPVAELPLRVPCAVLPTASILDLLNLFQTGRSHMARPTRHHLLHSQPPPPTPAARVASSASLFAGFHLGGRRAARALLELGAGRARARHHPRAVHDRGRGGGDDRRGGRRRDRLRRDVARHARPPWARRRHRVRARAAVQCV